MKSLTLVLGLVVFAVSVSALQGKSSEEYTDEDVSEENEVPLRRSNGQKTLQEEDESSESDENSDENESEENKINPEPVVPSRRSNEQERDLMQSIILFMEKTVQDYKKLKPASRRSEERELPTELYRRGWFNAIAKIATKVAKSTAAQGFGQGAAQAAGAAVVDAIVDAATKKE